MSFDRKEFIGFLMEAKKNTYAGGGQAAAPSRPVSRDLPYRKGDFSYLDSYFGSFNFIGEEAVWHSGIPVWGMNYYGEMLVESIPEGFSVFLKDALLQVPAEAPYRGPEAYESGLYSYRCRPEGDIGSFSGEETICLEGKPVYRLRFHGGYIR